MNRKVAYSGKKKREQLRERRNRKKSLDESEFFLSIGGHHERRKNTSAPLSSHFVLGEDITKEDFQHMTADRRKLISEFTKLTPQKVEEGKLASMRPFHRLPKTCLEVDINAYNEYIDIPMKPHWTYDMTKEEVDQREKASFDKWLNDMEEYRGEDMSYYEKNLEVWRQLWRVMEISDVILIIMDIRNPLLHFPRSLYHYVTKTLNRKVIGVFNKVDLVSKFTVYAWTKYFEEVFPDVHITSFSCYPPDDRFIDDTVTYALKKRTKKRKGSYYHAQGVKDMLSLCKHIVDKPNVHVDWKSLIDRYDEDHDLKHQEMADDDSDTGSMVGLEDEFSRILEVTNKHIIPHKDYITLGFIGHPNVGKSSVINSIMQRSVVSTSRTPGHTKHFQTIHISDHVRLCDCPGLVFPALIPRTLQILSGLYPIAQVQEPYTAIQYLAEHIELEKILSLTPPTDIEDMGSFKWSAWSICEAYAHIRGFNVAKTALLDVYRAANTILQLTNDGRILLSFKPPGFFSSTKYEIIRVKEADTAERTEEGDDDRVNLLVNRKYDYNLLLSDSE